MSTGSMKALWALLYLSIKYTEEEAERRSQEWRVGLQAVITGYIALAVIAVLVSPV